MQNNELESEFDFVISEKALTALMILGSLFFMLLFALIHYEKIEIIFFEVGFCWSFLSLSKKAREDSKTKKYRFSFLRFCLGIENFLNENLNRNNLFLIELILKILSPVIFTGSLLILFNTSDLVLFKLIHVFWGSVFAQTLIGFFLILMSILKTRR
ncbi:MAG: hypothetical protein U0T83_05920 [Bacteriovoracaceae bacterium]